MSDSTIALDLTPNMDKVLSSMFYDLTFTAWIHPDYVRTAGYDQRTVKALINRGLVLLTPNGYELSDEATAYCQQQFSQPYQVSNWLQHTLIAQQTLQNWMDKHGDHPIMTRFLYEGCAKRWHAAAIDYTVSGGAIVNPQLDYQADIARSIVNLIDNMSLN